MLKKAVQHGRSERRGESYTLPYVELLSDARTKLADFFSILLGSASGPARGGCHIIDSLAGRLILLR